MKPRVTDLSPAAAAAFVAPLYFEVSLKPIAVEVIVGGENGTHTLVSLAWLCGEI